ncbi:MAG: hypothetical protein PVSMB4_00460 [Ktedonobacterales bacterium]
MDTMGRAHTSAADEPDNTHRNTSKRGRKTPKLGPNNTNGHERSSNTAPTHGENGAHSPHGSGDAATAANGVHGADTNGHRPERPAANQDATQPYNAAPLQAAESERDAAPLYIPLRSSQTDAKTRELALRARRRRHRYTHYVMRSARARQAARSRSLVRAAWATTIILSLMIVAIITSTVSAAAAYYQSETPLLSALNRKVAAQDSVRIYDSRGTLLYQFNDYGAQHSISLAHIPVTVVNATVAVEDHDFWTNGGVDFQAIARAAYANATSGHIEEGASTITQQLIKQQVLSSNTTLDRKVKEAILSLGMTSQGVFTKRQVLEMYLNSIPYGPTTYGIDAAATTYFGYTDDLKTGVMAAQHLDLAQASLLAGLPQSPSYNNPLDVPDGFAHARARQQLVLRDMVSQGYITQAQADAAWQEAGQKNFFHPQLDQRSLAPHFTDYIRDQLDQMVTTGQLHGISRSGLNVYTTLDLDLQNHVQQAALDHLCGYDLNDYPGSPNRYIRDDNVTNAAAVIADHHTGAIKVLLGSVDYYGDKSCHKIDGKFDAATLGYRGPGSSFKPIVYATAFEKGWFPAFTIGNEPTVFWDAGAGNVYKPLNADNHHLTPDMTLRNALQLSQNIPAVKTMQFAGVNDVKQNAIRWGIHGWRQGSEWGLSSALGTLEVHLIDMVQVYTVFANYGQYIPLNAIDRITDSAGDVLFQYHVPQPIQVLSPQIAFLITNILSDNAARAPEFGRCSVLYLDPSTDDCYYHNGNSPNAWPVAAKTGTGQDLRDDWTMGYTMDYTMGVWAGNNDDSSMQWVDGVTGAAPIWYHSLLYAERNLPKTPFPVPSGVHRATYTSNGVTSTDWFIDGLTPPPDIGNTSPAPCVVYYDTGPDPWDYCGMSKNAPYP